MTVVLVVNREQKWKVNMKRNRDVTQVHIELLFTKALLPLLNVTSVE